MATHGGTADVAREERDDDATGPVPRQDLGAVRAKLRAMRRATMAELDEASWYPELVDRRAGLLRRLRVIDERLRLLRPEGPWSRRDDRTG